MSLKTGFFVLIFSVISLFFVEGIFKLIFHYGDHLLPKKVSQSYFENLKIPDDELGWGGGAARPLSKSYQDLCISAYGDSFTHADEVSNEEAWTNKLSLMLECEVRNFGVPGYGQDQAYLRMKSVPSEERGFVLFGIYREMLRRNLAGSWLFYSGEKKVNLKPYFYYSRNGKLALESPLKEDSVIAKKNHHSNSYLYRPYRFEFPYTVDFLEFIYTKAIIKDYGFFKSPSLVFRDEFALKLELDILEKAVKEQPRIALLLLPSPESLELDDPNHGPLKLKIKERFKNVCLLDPFAYLKSKITSFKEVKAENGHFNAKGNQLIAQYLADQIEGCPKFKQFKES